MKTALLIADNHYPYYSKPTFEIQKKIAKDLKPDYLVFMGDAFDANGISKFTNRDWVDGIAQTKAEIQGFRDKIFLPLINICNKAKIIYLLGNHDGQRITDTLNKIRERYDNTTFQDYRKQLDLKGYFPEADIYDYNTIFSIGKLQFTHGESHNKYHTNTHLEQYMGSLIYGHMHATQIFTKIAKGNQPFQAISIPCSCELNPDYKKNRASTWVNGGAVTYHLPNGNFYYDIFQVINKQTIFNGKLYQV